MSQAKGNPSIRTDLFENYPIPKAVATLSIPTVMSSLVALFYSLADTYFVGMLNMPVETAAVTIISPMILAFNAVNNLFGVGSSSMMSRALGLKDVKTVRESSALGLYGAFISSIIFAVICTVFKTPLLHLLGADHNTFGTSSSYMFWTVSLGAVPAIMNVVFAYQVRSEGASLAASIGTMGGCLLNIILDPFFILPWGLNMKAEGAAMATFLSNVCACIYFLSYLMKNKKTTNVSINPKYITLKKNIVNGICGVGIPASIQNLLNVVGTSALNVLATPFGAPALAAIGICSKVAMIPMQVSMGISQGIMPLISYNYSANNKKRMRQTILFTCKISFTILLICSISMMSFPGFFIRLFIEDAETVAYGSVLLRGFSLAVPFLAMDFVAVGVFQAVGLGKNSLFFAIARKALLEIPLMFVLNHFWPLYGLPYAQVTAEIILSILAIIMLRKILSDNKKDVPHS